MLSGENGSYVLNVDDSMLKEAYPNSTLVLPFMIVNTGLKNLTFNINVQAEDEKLRIALKAVDEGGVFFNDMDMVNETYATVALASAHWTCGKALISIPSSVSSSSGLKVSLVITADGYKEVREYSISVIAQTMCVNVSVTPSSNIYQGQDVELEINIFDGAGNSLEPEMVSVLMDGDDVALIKEGIGRYRAGFKAELGRHVLNIKVFKAGFLNSTRVIVLDANPRPMTLLVNLERSTYIPGLPVKIAVTAVDGLTGQPIRSATVSGLVKTPTGSMSLHFKEREFYEGIFVLSPHAEAGDYNITNITVVVEKTGYRASSANATIKVLPAPIVDLKFNIGLREDGCVVVDTVFSFKVSQLGELKTYTMGLSAEGDVDIIKVLGGDPPFNISPMINRIHGKIIVSGSNVSSRISHKGNFTVMRLLLRLNGPVGVKCFLVPFNLTVIEAANSQEISVIVAGSPIRFTRGDANNDGHVTIADAMFIAQYLAGLRDEYMNLKGD